MTTGNAKTHTPDLRATGLRFSKDRLIVTLADDREVSVPLSRYPTLAAARPAARNAWHLLGPGTAFRWPSLDLDLSVPALLAGLPEAIPAPPKLRRKPSPAAARKAS